MACGPWNLPYMNKTIRTFVAAALLSTQPLAYACDYPTKAEIPNGATATKEDMIAGQRRSRTTWPRWKPTSPA